MLASIRAELTALDEASALAEEEVNAVSQALIGSDASSALAVDVSDSTPPTAPTHPFNTLSMRAADIKAAVIRHEVAHGDDELSFKPRITKKGQAHTRDLPVEEMLHDRWRITMQKREQSAAEKAADEERMMKETSAFRTSRKNAELARRYAERTGKSPSERLYASGVHRRGWLDSQDIDWEVAPFTPRPKKEDVRNGSGSKQPGFHTSSSSRSEVSTAPSVSAAAWRRAHSARGPVPVEKRNAQWAQARQHRMAYLQDQHNRRTSAECTFQPEMNPLSDRLSSYGCAQMAEEVIQGRAPGGDSFEEVLVRVVDDPGID